MKTIMQQINKKRYALLFVLISPLISMAQNMPSAAEEAAQNARIALYSEIGIGVLFVVAVASFLVYKTRYDKKVRDQQLKQMQQMQANKRKAA
jgi:hypothetical protein